MNALSPSFPNLPTAPTALAFLKRRLMEVIGTGLLFVTLLLALALFSYNAGDPSFSRAVDQAPHNILGRFGADLSDVLIQAVGEAALLLPLLSGVWGLRLILNLSLRRPLLRLLAIVPALLAASIALQILPGSGGFGPPTGSGGVFGWAVLREAALLDCPPIVVSLAAAALLAPLAMVLFGMPTFTRAGFRSALSYRPPLDMRELGRAAGSMGAASGRVGGKTTLRSVRAVGRVLGRLAGSLGRAAWSRFGPRTRPVKPQGVARDRYEPQFGDQPLRSGPTRPPNAARRGSTEREPYHDDNEDEREDDILPQPGSQPAPRARDERDGTLRGQPMALRPDLVSPGKRRLPPGKRAEDSRQATLDLEPGNLTLPPLGLLQPPPRNRPAAIDQDALEQNARLLVGVLDDFGVRGEIVKIRPGPVVTLYELEPAPGTKSSRVIGLADDLARSMSAISVRVAVIPGRNVIGIELPNAKAETVVLRELVESGAYEKAQARLTLVLGKDIGGEPVIADLAKMPHLLIAGTTGSGKSVGINTMILSILYRMPPSLCKFIMIDPKMLELSIYDGIPHLLSPVVTDPRKAVVALKWTVREMEDRYRAMSKLGVRNIEGYNAKLAEANARGETLVRKVQTGFDPETGEPIVEDQLLDLSPLPFIIVVVDEMADLMLVAGKDIEAAIQRLAQMARAAGIHIIMATQRPSVDVITGTIKANFPTRISFQVTSKIDSRTILGESGAEQLLGRGDMLYMAGGGRITRVHGPFVSDGEVEEVVNFLKSQGKPNYIDNITEGDEDELPQIDPVGGAGGDGSDALYDQAVALVARERKASTSFVQRHLQIGYNRAARIIERMEMEGVVSAPNHVAKREVLAPKREY